MGDEYSDNYAYFIAGGKTLAAIEKYLDDKANVRQRLDAIAREFGAQDIFGYEFDAHMIFDRQPADHPALRLVEREGSDENPSYLYQVDAATPEGRALLARIGDIPQTDIGQQVFARRLMGAATVETNPDNLRQSYGNGINNHYNEGASATAATFSKYGETYVVSVPRVVRGIFNAASKKALEEKGHSQVAGYVYDWQTPPDCQPIPLSKVIELREREKGDQLTPRAVMRPTAVSARKPKA
jgi:hypothetical protein